MSSIDSRIASIVLALERRKMEQIQPVDELSKSLFAFGRELIERDKSDLLEELNTDGLSISMEDLERFIADFSGV